jgi:tetratricopeptide (TPR) repeat protein
VSFFRYFKYLEFKEKAGTFLEEEQYDNAIKIFDTILMLNPKQIEALNGKGSALCKQEKKYEEALRCFNEVLKINARRPDASVYVEMIKDRINKERNRQAKASSKETEHDTAVEERTKKK